MRKRVVSILLTVVITAGLLTGCGGQNQERTDENVEETATAEAEEDVWMTEDVAEEEYTSGDYTADAYNDTADGAYPEAMEESAGTDQGYTNSKADMSVPRYDDELAAANNEEYSEVEENPFYIVKETPLSTFSADVDTASYTNIRRMLESGYGIEDIPSGAVRIEEMLNYFTYDLEKPKGKTPFAVTTEVSDCPWNEYSELLMVGISTKDIDFSEAPPSNIVFLLDVSGSMSDEDKLPLLQKAFSMLTDNLTSKDRVSIVTYASDVQVVLEGAKGSDTEEILSAINELSAGGATNGGNGIQTAYELAEANFIKGGNNRVILATDGDLNVGPSSEEELEELIAKKKESGVFLSVLGFGTGNLKDNKMEVLADKGNGNYSYIDSNREAKKVLVKEMGATLMTVAKDVKFQVEFNPEVVERYRLIGYENRVMDDFDFEDDTKDAGEIGAGHSMIALYEIVPVSASEESDDSIKLKYQDGYVTKKNSSLGEKDGDYCTVKIRYKEPDGEKSKESEYPVAGDTYTSNPSEDFQFAARVAQFGMILKQSKYDGDSNLEDVLEGLSELDLDDEYKMEFYFLVKMAGGFR